MRRLLRLMNFIKRARTATTAAPGARKYTPPEAVNGHRQTRTSAAPKPKLADVVAARRRERWEAPELEGPEFGGLIERRGTDTRGLMPKPFKPDPDPGFKARQPSQLGTDPGHVNVRPKSAADAAAEAEAEAALESTGMFLSALDNSAITLADSGMFRIAETDERTAAEAASFNPYNRGGDKGYDKG